MSRKITLPVLLLCIFGGNLSMAQPSADVTKSPIASPVSKVSTISIYEAPDLKAKVIREMNPQERFIPIFVQDQWVKVGSPKDGQVGWINKQQYKEAVQTVYQPNIQTVFIRTEQDKDGKPEVKVVAYKNGKALSEEEAKKLYEQVQKSQVRQSEYFQHMFFNLDNMMEQNMRELNQMNRFWDYGIGGAAIVQPVIVISPSSSDVSSTPSSSPPINKK